MHTRILTGSVFLIVFGCALAMPSDLLACAAGNKAKVLWQNSHYQATVVSVSGDKFCIHYDGWENKWDECVTSDRIQCTGSELPFKAGEAVDVEWNGTYYKSTIKEVKNGQYCINYTGWASSYDECVVPKRVKQ